MTFSANRNNIKPMFFFVAVPVMILLGVCGAVMALESISSRQFAIFNSVIYSFSCFTAFRMTNAKAFENSFALRLRPVAGHVPVAGLLYYKE